MADPEKDKQMQIDEMLDSLLANYSAAEPSPGWKPGYWRTCGRRQKRKRHKDGGISNGFGQEWLRRQLSLRRC